MECPRCPGPVELKKVTFESEGVAAEAQRCPKCQGHFFARQDLNLVSAKPTQAKVSFERIPDAGVQLAPIHCPGCGAADPMLKAQSKKENKVTLDACAVCGGIWLDRGELDAIRGAAASVLGGARDWFKSRS